MHKKGNYITQFVRVFHVFQLHTTVLPHFEHGYRLYAEHTSFFQFKKFSTASSHIIFAYFCYMAAVHYIMHADSACELMTLFHECMTIKLTTVLVLVYGSSMGLYACI